MMPCIAAAGRSSAGRGCSGIVPRRTATAVTVATGGAHAAIAAAHTGRLGSRRSASQVQNAASAIESA
jgi:hypothetical protein